MPRITDPTLDLRLGARIRAARIASRLSQTTLAERMGVSYQQLQQCEAGTVSLSVAVLVLVAKMLCRPVADFLDEGEPADQPLTSIPDMRRAFKVADQIARLPKPTQRRLLALVEALVEVPNDETKAALAA